MPGPGFGLGADVGTALRPPRAGDVVTRRGRVPEGVAGQSFVSA